MDFVPAATDCHIDNLPDEVFAQILNLLPIKQVIRCATVSKRWDAACRYIIRTRESLVIGQAYSWPGLDPPAVGGSHSYHPYDDTKWEWGWFRQRPSWRLDGIRLAKKSLISAIMKTLNQMVELGQLVVESRETAAMDIVIPFMRKFAEQLTMLEIDFAVSLIGADAFPHLTRLRCRVFDANPSAAFPKLAELLISGKTKDGKLPNMRLPSLKKLVIMSFMYYAELVREFILANAETLMVLQMDGTPLQLGRAVVFPNLMKLDCRDVAGKCVCKFPALTHLTVSEPVTAEFLSSLPADLMLSLDANFIHDRKDVVSAISKMKNMKRLKLYDRAHGEVDGLLSSIFDKMHHLQQVRLYSIDFHNEQVDRMIATLSNQNPILSDVYFDRIRMTDAALTSLAQLQHLTDIELHHSEYVTTAGALTLLRGSSRNVIRTFIVDGEQVEGYQVTREISLMCEERGTTFRAPHTGCFEYFIHG